jgi:hypothetical protein
MAKKSWLPCGTATLFSRAVVKHLKETNEQTFNLYISDINLLHRIRTKRFGIK